MYTLGATVEINFCSETLFIELVKPGNQKSTSYMSLSRLMKTKCFLLNTVFFLGCKVNVNIF